jgi:Mrr N-terminal domain/Domain of unknown function (DUF3387)
MLPLLRFAEDGQEHSLREAIEKLADHFGLSSEERNELLPSGRQRTFDNRVGWASTYLKKTMCENVRAHLRVLVKRILRKNGYPPDKQEQATRTVLQQAEVLSQEWAVA